MVPIQLRLQNFLSYGTAAEPLDFDRFHVACLSGGNGQGKSALLDAITWALWGEARKSGDARKPDAELLHIGAREMQVEFTFDLEGERYRILRSYYETASGKNSKPGLEIQVLDSDSGQFRPLTTGSIGDTQKALNDLLRIDYDTFINSAFLLQGRSDEFTRKKPGERKQILARILNLSRYAKLAELAGEKARTAEQQLAHLDYEIERLTAALEPEGQWQEERGSIATEAAEAQARLEARQAEDAALAEQLAVFDVRASECETLRKMRAENMLRRTKLGEDAAALAARIAEAEAILATETAIREAYQHHQKLTEEREQLDTRRDVARGIEVQLHAQKQQLQQRRMELETKLNRLDTSLAYDRRTRDDIELKLREEPVLRSEHAAAAQARKQVEQFDRIERQQRELDEKLAKIEAQISKQRGSLEGQLQNLTQRIAQQEKSLVRPEALRQQVEQLRKDAVRLDTLRRDMDAVKQRGTEVRGQLDATTQRIEAMNAQIAELEAKKTRMQELEAATCPTCSTELTPQHRQHVVNHYQKDIAAIVAQRQEAQREADGFARQRQEFGRRYKELEAEMQPLAEAPQHLARIEEKLTTLAAEEAALEESRKQAAEIEQYLKSESFADDLRRERAGLLLQRQQLQLDEAAHAFARSTAARLEHLEKQLAEIEPQRERQTQLTRKIERDELEATAIRRDLDEGVSLRPLQDKIAHLEAQLAQVGYDPDRHQQVRRHLDDLREAPARFEGLLNARDNLADWTARRDALLAEAAELGAACEKYDVKIAELEAYLQDRGTLEQQRQALSRDLLTLQQRLRDLQTRTGELDARLEQCRLDREQLRQRKAEHKKAKHQRALYRQLKTAFGKNGIPALIIEQTLPEIEDRANLLLHRLTDGRTSVKLETLKDKKSGGTKETLDIKIIDDLGVSRAYETFSGGEAFRVNFALRIALAQLLAERNGVRIRTLVVDEGFGTQDKQGIQNLIEAIQTIREDFSKILVITHLDEMKEAFPVRIEVQKHPGVGSTYEVLGV